MVQVVKLSHWPGGADLHLSRRTAHVINTLIWQTCKQRAMWFPVEMEYQILPDIFQLKIMVTWLHFVRILFIPSTQVLPRCHAAWSYCYWCFSTRLLINIIYAIVVTSLLYRNKQQFACYLLSNFIAISNDVCIYMSLHSFDAVFC